MIEELIDKYYSGNPDLHKIYLTHVHMVRDKALEVAERVPELDPDLKFIEEASLLHDIGIVRTDAPDIFATGELPYIAHGYIGRVMLEAENLPKHGLVAERHTGVGISKEQIIAGDLPLPHRDMLPISIEEKIVCYADNFYSKNPEKLEVEKSLDQIRQSLAKFGDEVLTRFEEMVVLFKD